MVKRILIVEDDAAICEIVTDYFVDAGFLVTEASDGDRALNAFEEADYDLVLLDLMLPLIDGFTLCRRFRSKKSTPIIIITARSSDDDKLLGYELGADDYIEKPFNPKVLLAKAKNLLLRNDGLVGRGGQILTGGGITIDLSSFNVSADGENLDLTPKEYALLVTLMQNKNIVLTRDTLLSKVWGYDYFGDLRVVDTHIKSLRRKLKDYAYCIITKIKAGYMFDENVKGK
jgi:DNA-binding response OmpR family regulator